MANNKKFVVKNGLTTSNIEFKDDINNGTNTITMSMLSTDVLSFSGDSGQLFSISDSLTGTIFSVNDISGIPSVEVDDDGTIRLAEFAGNILVGSNTDNGSDKLQVTGNTSVNGTIKATDFTIGTSGKLTSNNYIQTQLGTKLNSSSYTASDVLTKIKTVDGSGSGLDADTLDGLNSTSFSSNNYVQSQLGTKLNSSSYTASDVLTKIKTVDGSGSGLDADLLDGINSGSFVRSDSNDTVSGQLTLNRNLVFNNNSTDTYPKLDNNNSDRMWLDGFVAIPKGYSGGDGLSFRFDDSETAYIFDRFSGVSYSVTAGTNPGSTIIERLFGYTNNYFNLNSYKDASNNFEFTVSGLSLSNSSNTQWSPYVLFHSGGGSVTTVIVEGLEGDGTTWTELFNGDAQDVIAPLGFISFSTGVLKGLKFKFRGITGNSYLKMVGVTSRTTESFTWQMLKTGGEFYGDISGKSSGTGNWSITQAGAASFSTVDGRDVAADGSKLDGIESGATADQTASEILTAIKTVDGAGSGLDADTLDGLQGSSYSSNNYITDHYTSNNYIQTYVAAQVASVVDSAPAALDTLNELAAALGDDANFSTTVSNQIGIRSTNTYVNSTFSSNNYLQGQLNGKLNSSSYTASDVLTKIKTVDGSGSGLDADTLDGQHGSYYAQYDHFRSLGTTAFTGTNTTAGMMSEIEGDGGFDSYTSAFKTSWSYAGNFDLSDGGSFGPTETAGMSFLTWTDNSSDSTRGNITVLAIAPTTGGSAGGVYVYNDQGSTYSPGWREIWTSSTDGSGSGLDADLLDGIHASGLVSNNYFQDNAGGGATGGGSDKIFYNNDQTVTTSYSIPSGQNSMTAGPISINSGVTVTVPSGSEWTIV